VRARQGNREGGGAYPSGGSTLGWRENGVTGCFADSEPMRWVAAASVGTHNMGEGRGL
jgi:hypothetical protein